MKNLKLLSSSIALATILTLSGCGDDSATGVIYLFHPIAQKLMQLFKMVKK